MIQESDISLSWEEAREQASSLLGDGVVRMAIRGHYYLIYAKDSKKDFVLCGYGMSWAKALENLQERINQAMKEKECLENVEA